MILEQRINTFEYITSDSDLKAAVKYIEEYKSIVRKKKRPRFTFDLETYPDIDGIEDFSAEEAEKAAEAQGIYDYRPIKTLSGGYEANSRLFQLGLDPKVEDLQFLFDVKELGSDQLAYYHKDSIEECLLIGHYIIYDLEFLLSDQYNLFPKYPRCTCIGPQLWLAGDNIDLENPDPRKKQRYALYACYEKFLDWGWFKSYTGKDIKDYVEFKLKNQKSNWGARTLSSEQLQYASDDVRILHWLYSAEMDYLQSVVKKYDKPGLIETYKLECETIPAFAAMGLVGLEADVDQLNTVIADFEDEIKKGKDELSRYKEFWREMSETRGRGANKVTRTWCEFINLNSKPGRGKKDPETGEKPKTRGQLLTSLDQLGIHLESTGREYLQELVYDPESTITDEQREVLLKILAYKVPAYMNTKYGRNLLKEIHSDGRFHPRYFQIGGKESDGGLEDSVDTQRTTAVYPAIQTFPSDEVVGAKVRKVISAAPGKKLIVLDFANQEVKIAYMLTKDPYLYKVFTEGRDQHSETGQFVLGLDYLPVKDEKALSKAKVPAKISPDERQVGKTAYLAHQYQQGWKQFIKKTYEATKCQKRLTEAQARSIKDNLKEQYPGITKKINSCNLKIDKALEDFESLRYFANRRPIFVGFTEMRYKFEDTGEEFKYTRMKNWCLKLEHERLAKQKFETKADDPLGKWFARWNEEKEKFETWNNYYNSRVGEIKRQYFNFLIQPEGATLLKLSMREIFKAFKENYYSKGYSITDVCMVLECHDEIAVECLEELAEEVKELVEKIMNRCFRAIVKGIPVGVSGSIGSNWSEAK